MTRSYKSQGSSRTLFRVAVAFSLVVAVAGFIWYATRPNPVLVVVATVSKGRVEETVSNTRAGSVKACRRAKLAPSTGGQVWRLPIKEGDRVKKGDVLLELWNKDLAAQIALAESQAAAARSRAEEACIQADHARSEFERARTLFADGLASDEELEHAQFESDARRASCVAARAAVKESESSVSVARAAFERTVLTSPFDGVVAEINAELGEYVTPSPPGIPTPPAVDLIEDGCLYIVAPIDEVDAPQVRPGFQTRVTLDCYPDQVFPGRVKRVDPFVLEREKQARTVDVEVDMEDPSVLEQLVPGYSADVEVLIDARDDVLRVPTEAILEGKKVLVLANGLLEERIVEKGISNWQFTSILSGLADGEQIVTSLGREGVQAGARAVAE